MLRPTPQSASPPELPQLLEAVRRASEDDRIRLLAAVPLRSGPEAHPDELFLRGELVYLQGATDEGARLFEAYDKRTLRDAPPWQRLWSAQRRMVAYFRNGHYERARRALSVVEELVGVHGDLRDRQCAIDAMHGHFLELEGDYDAARARFAIGYDRALEAQRWGVAAQIAADVARVATDQRDYDVGREWLKRAREANATAPSQRMEQVIDIREARIFRLVGDYPTARAIYDRVLTTPLPDRQLYALLERAELLGEMKEYELAEADLQRAITLCEQYGVRQLTIAATRSLADLYLARAESGDPERTRGAFAAHARFVLSTRPVPLQPLMELARAILDDAGLIGRKSLPVTIRQPLTEILARSAPLSPPPLSGRALRNARAAKAQTDLWAALLFLKDPEMNLAHWVVSTSAAKAMPRSGVGESHALTPGELEMLDQLVEAQGSFVTTTELADRLGRSAGAIGKLVEHLRKKVTPDLLTRHPGASRGPHAYALQLHRSQS